MLFVKESPIAAPPDRLFAFHASPGALQRLTPPWEQVKLVEGGDSIRVGARVVLETKVGPVPLRWVAEHVEYDPPHAFADIQVSGPFRSWHHRHEFLADGPSGSTLRDVVHYEVPLGALGRLGGGWYVRRKLQKMFDYRHEVTKRIVEAGDFADPPAVRGLISRPGVVTLQHKEHRPTHDPGRSRWNWPRHCVRSPTSAARWRGPRCSGGIGR